MQRLKTLCDVPGRLPFGLPPQLETLEYAAGPASDVGPIFSFGSRQLEAAAEAVLRLRNLQKLTELRCWPPHLLLGFWSGLPSTM